MVSSLQQRKHPSNFTASSSGAEISQATSTRPSNLPVVSQSSVKQGELAAK
jgi:hypothetical protein